MALIETDRLDVGQLAALIAKCEISPVELVNRALERLDETEPSLNAFVTIDRGGALAQARRAEKNVRDGEVLGPLHGIPVSVKDLIAVAGMPCTFGSLIMKDYVPEEDAPSVARLRQAGAVIIGKTTTSEFGYRGYTKSLVHGNTANPWDLSRTPGGSSGGAVASVAAGVTPIALGTDGGGSIRTPCAFTGLVGLKATFGRVPVWPASATPTLAHVGPIARNVADAERLLRVVSGPDLRDPFSLYPVLGPDIAEESVRTLRVAFSPTLGYGKVDEGVRVTVANAVRRLGAIWPNIELVESVIPDPAEILATEFIGGCSARLGSAVDDMPEKIDPPLLDAIKSLRALGSDCYTRIVRGRIAHRERLRRFFGRFDLLLTPTTPCVGWDIARGVPPGHENAAVWSYFTYPFNLGHQPAASLPCGFGEGGMPVGLQFVTQMLEEPTLIASLRMAEAALGIPVVTPVEPTRR